MGKRRSYSNEEKAAVMAALLAGQSVSEVADEYKIPEGTVKGWSSKLDRDPSVPTTKKEEIGDLLVESLRENIETIRYISEKIRNEDWILKQDAASLATLFGVKMDKAIKVIEAFGEADG